MPSSTSKRGHSSSRSSSISRARSRSQFKKTRSQVTTARGSFKSDAIEIDDDTVELAKHTDASAYRVGMKTPISLPSSPQIEVASSTDAKGAWQAALSAAQTQWGNSGAVEGYGGLEGTISGELVMYAVWENLMIADLQATGRSSLSCRITCEDMEGGTIDLFVAVDFAKLNEYPEEYQVNVKPQSGVPQRLERSLNRFTKIHRLDIAGLLLQLVHALQGDDEAHGVGANDDVDMAYDAELDEGDPGYLDFGDADNHGLPAATAGEVGYRFTPESLARLRDDFDQAKAMGYRSGVTQVSDHWVISYSIPFKNVGIDPNTLAMWDDSLVDAWKADDRFTMLLKIESYPAPSHGLHFMLGSYPAYKPPLDVIVATERRSVGAMKSVFLSLPLQTHLQDAFVRAWKLVTSYDISWDDADRVVFDPDLSKQVFEDGIIPDACQRRDANDPIALGFGNNLALCAFFWTLRRFRRSTDFCQTCGAAVEVVSLRPYVCSKPLCIYRFMSLGFGPSAEYIVQTHPHVVDILLSLAWTSAKGSTRMDLPLHLHIQMPPDYVRPAHKSKILDELPENEQRSAVAWLIEQMPRVSIIKESLDAGEKLPNLMTSGSLGVLRWIIGSCRAYLKGVRPGDGIQTQKAQPALGYSAYDGTPAHHPRQFAFVVGSPEQEMAFKEEIEKAQAAYRKCREHPTMLVFHGSALERWHNILRTGLDFSEVANARAYGHGVYFAGDDSTSRVYARGSLALGSRPNADFALSSVMAVVELVNVPDTFVSRQPYYVVNNTRQIKPFLLLAYGSDVPPDLGLEDEKPEEEAETPDVVVIAPPQVAEPPIAPLLPLEKAGAFFKHDPSLSIQPRYGGEPLQLKMPSTLKSCLFVDEDEDDPEQQAILRPSPPIPAPRKTFHPSPQSRFDRLRLMPPPNETSTMASRTLQREFKQVVTLQKKGELPFYIDPESESLYCWVVELYGFAEDSQLMKDMERKGIKSIIAEIRFPATFPNSPPFMRILHPRCLPFSSGGGGNITAGGSICNEILTASGWNPVFCVEAMVRDIMTNMTEAIPPARLDTHRWDQPYTLSEATEAFKRVAAQHGWQVPRDFDKMAN